MHWVCGLSTLVASKQYDAVSGAETSGGQNGPAEAEGTGGAVETN